jgi:hypothetical protein
MAGLHEELEEVGFKPTAGGYVFQTNSRWFIGPRRSYLVTEAQKVEISVCARETMKSVKRFALIAFEVLPLVVVAGGAWLASQRGTLLWTVLLEALAMAFVLLLPCMVLVHIDSMRRLAPLLAGLPRADAGMPVREGDQQFAATISIKLLVAMIGGMAFFLVGTLRDLATALGEHDLIDAGMSALIAAGLGCMVVYYAYLAFLRVKSKTRVNVLKWNRAA